MRRVHFLYGRISENRDGYIGALLGEILIKVKEPPHKWEVTKSAFDEILQIQSTAYGTKGTAPLPDEYAKVTVPTDKITTLEQKKFIASIREIKYDKMIPNAMSDYWKADLTVAKYFRDNLMYLSKFYKVSIDELMGVASDDKQLSDEAQHIASKKIGFSNNIRITLCVIAIFISVGALILFSVSNRQKNNEIIPVNIGELDSYDIGSLTQEDGEFGKE